MFRRELLLPAAIASLIADALTFWLLGEGGHRESSLTRHAITGLILLFLAGAWFAVILSNVALGLVRGEDSNLISRWVPVTTALQIGLVSIALAFPIALGTLLLIAPGVYLLVIWSQVTMVLVDDRARLFDATSWSESLTGGFRLQILTIWLVVWGGAALIDFGGTRIASTGGPGAFPEPLAIGVSWLWHILLSVVNIALVAAIYDELLNRAPWYRSTAGCRARRSGNPRDPKSP